MNLSCPKARVAPISANNAPGRGDGVVYVIIGGFHGEHRAGVLVHVHHDRAAARCRAG
jgi:hypothetical protein